MTTETMIQPKVTGYRQLTPEEAALMNEIKALGPVFSDVCKKIEMHIAAQRAACATSDAQAEDPGCAHLLAEQQRLDLAEPERWLNWGRDAMQANLMYLTRAVAQPTSF